MACFYKRTSDLQLLMMKVQKFRMIYFLNVNENGFKYKFPLIHLPCSFGEEVKEVELDYRD